MNTIAIRCFGPWTALAGFVLLSVAMAAIGPMLRAALLPLVEIKTAHDIILFRLATGLPLSWLALGGTLLILRARGQGLGDIGWRRPAAIWGWLGAALVVGFFIWGSFRGPYCRGMCFIDPQAWATDWSAFRIVTSVAIGLTAGFCEEISFRGFVMTQARDGGAPWPVQVLLSGLTFGLAHISIAGLAGHFDPAAALSIVASTTVFGLIFGIVFLLARRSLTPLILAHGVFAFTTEPWLLLWNLHPAVH